MPTTLLVALVLAVQSPRTSPFNLYAAHLRPVALNAACRIEDASYLHNLAYPFRGPAYPWGRVLHFKDGRFDERVPGGGVEWSTTLEQEQSVTLGREAGALLGFEADHLGGSGSASHVMVVRCRARRLQIVFEAGGAGVEASYSGSGDLNITYPLWRRDDSHASPSRVVEEHYCWNAARGRFALVRRTARASEPGPQ